MIKKMNLYKLLTALLCCVILAGLLPATALAQDTATSGNALEAALTDGWTQCGTCEWMIDDDGVLTIRPLGDGSEGTLADWGYTSPWRNNTTIKSVVVKAGVKAATCSSMFDSCTNLTTADLSGLNTSNVTNMSRMFDSCSSLASLDLSNFDTGSVTSMSFMFGGCFNLASLDLSSFDTCRVKNMGSMFHKCSSLASLDLSSFNTSSVTIMNGMFGLCTSLASLDLSSFNTDSVTDMGWMFIDCSALKELILGTNFNFKDRTVLTAPSTASKWTNGALSLTSNELMEQYNGSTMAGTWVREMVTLTDGWTQCGTCKWMIDDDGVLTIRPLGDGSEGTLAYWSYYTSPWKYNPTIKSVVVKAGVKVPACSGMFYGCSNLASLDLSGLDTSDVTDMRQMFDGCSALTSLDLSSFDTSNVTDMRQMFDGCSALTSLDLSSFDTSNVTDMYEMFNRCSALTSLDLSSFNTSNVTSMGLMFDGCSALTSLDLSSFDTSNVTSINAMFNRCSALTSLNLSSFDTSNITYIGSLFDGCEALKELTLGTNFNFKDRAVLPAPSTATPYTGKWTNGALSLTANELMEQYNGSTMAGTWVWETETITLTDGWTQCGTCEWMIDEYGVLTIRPLGDGSEGTLADWDRSPWSGNFDITSVVVKAGVKATTCHLMFYGRSALTSLDLSNLDTSNVTDMSNMFAGCLNLTSLDLSSFDTSNVTDMNHMFDSCEALTSLDLSSFNTSNVTDMTWMFFGCSNLTSLNLSGFDTSNVTSMRQMFFWCSNLTSLDLSSFDTGNVISMGAMFGNCSALTSLDLSSFDTSKVTSLDSMFGECQALTSLDLSNFDTGSVTGMHAMFAGCSNLASLDLSNFDTGNVTDMSNMFSGCSALKELTLGTNFNFKDGAVLPAPSTASPYTGKWTNGALSLTANELKSQYNGFTMAGTWIWETSQTDEDDQTNTSFVPAEDGSWYVYVNGKINTSVDNTLHFYNNAFFWIEKGKWNDKKYAFVDYAGARFLVANGQTALGQHGLTQDPENEEIWYFCSGGQIQAQAKGLVMYQDEWFNVQNGRLDTTFSGYVDYDGSKFLVAAGRICSEVKGLVQDPNPNNAADWYYVADGQVTTSYTGLVLYNERWFYVENGKLNAGYTGSVEYNGQIFEVINGELP